MLSLKMAISGGESLIASAHTVHNMLLDWCRDLLGEFYEGFVLRRPEADAERMGRPPLIGNVPSFAYENGWLNCDFQHGYMRRAIEHGDTTISPQQEAALGATKAPIKYVIYSHSHFDHIAGGQPFKDLGAIFVAHKNAKARIEALKRSDVVVPDEVVDGKKNVTLGGTTLELNYVGKNHSDSTLVMRLPKEKIIFTVDWIPIQGVQFRGMADTYVPDIEEGLKK